MRLRKLHIKGFKSFADETILNFDEQVIGVVGPNGSGKSNVVDAIRWVLGEQKSRELRLENMTDVIFNGAENRKRSGVAQVSLTFDNTKNILPTEYQSVTISRLLYRSGESEYRLNNVACRLKDITTLFMDTGIGSNSYAIIALGMVDDILADKEKARRKMFEQAAGISKFKIRKRETLNKLKATSSDLDRIEDLLYELDQNLKTLEKQAKRARKYYEIKEEYKNFAVHAARFKIEKVNQERADIDEKIKKEINILNEMTASISKLEAEVQKHKSTHLEKELNLSTFQKTLNELINKNRDLEREKSLAKDKLNFNTNQKDRASRDLENYNRDIASKKAEIKELENTFESLKTQLVDRAALYEKSNAEYQSLKQTFDKAQNAFNRVESEKNKVEERIYGFEKDKAVKQNQISNYQNQLKQLNENNANRKNQFEQAELAQVQNEKLIKELDEKVNLEREGEERRKEKLSQLESQLKSESQKLFSFRSKRDTLKNERGLIQNMIDNLEGFPASIKFVSEQKGDRLPLLADIVAVDDEVRAGVENYLDQYLNYFVAKDLKEAIGVIQLLTEAQKGKANFFLLDQFKGTKGASKSSDSGMKSVLDYLDYEPEYAGLFEHLFKNVYATTSSLAVQQNIEDNQVILSGDGSFIRKEKSVSGGSIGLFEGNKLGRKNNLAKIEKDLDKIETSLGLQNDLIVALENEIKTLRSHQSDNNLSSLVHQLNKKRNEEAGLKVKLESAKQSMEQIAQREGVLMNSLQTTKDEIGIIEEEIAKAKKQLTDMSNQPDLFGGDINELSQSLSQSLAAVNQQQIELIRQENEKANKEQALSFKTNQIEELQNYIKRNQDILEDSEKSIAELKSKIKGFEDQLLSSYQEQKDKEKELSGVERVYFEARAEINEKEDTLRNLNRNFGTLQSFINELKEKRTQKQFQLNAIHERLEIEFNIKKDEIGESETDIELNPQEVIERVDRLKKRIENYGEINPMAMEAYEEMKERHLDITKQRDDILEAKESLLSTIEEIEATAAARFMESFNQVRANFKEVFRSLFTENDDCDLVLMNAESPLEADIEIIAKPKGKRPQSLSQLSGGEKTLTATALLFALYLLKPAPFCIFDEVDAPLDDSNIQKFNKIIKKFSKDSQFIVVTHNKLTMAEVDTLYGVYMQEKGVSGVSQVDLREYEHKTEFQPVN